MKNKFISNVKSFTFHRNQMDGSDQLSFPKSSNQFKSIVFIPTYRVSYQFIDKLLQAPAPADQEQY